MRASVSLLAALAQDALLEGWLSVAAGLLYRLLEISRPLVAVRVCHAFYDVCSACLSAIPHVYETGQVQGTLPELGRGKPMLRSLNSQRQGIALACTSLALQDPHKT